jgi:hypothetical protein
MVTSRQSEPRSISRRDAIKKGALVGGALVWATPVVQTIGMKAPLAQETSPLDPDISYIGMAVVCDDGTSVTTGYIIKFEGCTDGDCFDPDPGNFPVCDGFPPEPAGVPADGDGLGFTATGPREDGSVLITVPDGCEVTSSVIKGGQCCADGPVGVGLTDLVFYRPHCP